MPDCTFCSSRARSWNCGRLLRQRGSALTAARRPFKVEVIKSRLSCQNDSRGEESMAQTIEAFVGTALDDAKISPLHRRVVALIAAGYFFDVIDFTILGSLIPYILKSGFTTAGEAAAIGSATIFGMCIGTAGQGELSDRFGRRFIAGLGLGAEQPLCFAYAGEYSPKRIRGRILAIIHFIGGAMVWPIGTA